MASIPLKYCAVASLFVVLATYATGCGRGRDKHEQNRSAANVVMKEELDEMTQIHKLDIHLDEGDELHDRYEVQFDDPPEDHPPTR